MTDIGRAGMVMKGDYNSANTYEALDVVGYQNGLYVAKQAVPVNTVPTNTTYWQVAISDGGVYFEINTNDLVQDTRYTIDLPTGYTIDNTSIIAINYIAFSTRYDSGAISRDENIRIDVSIISGNKISYVLKGQYTIGVDGKLYIKVEKYK